MNNNEIKLEQIVAGALLKFESLDNVDLSLILDDFLSNCSDEVNTYFFMEKLNGYLYYYPNGKLSINYEKPLNYFIENENRTVREKYEEVAGNKVLNYFNNINIDKFKQNKENILKKRFSEIKSNANILLISDVEEDYNQMVNYGFKNINYFKSIIIADKYFKKHPEKLEQYHIVLTGNQNVLNCCLDGNVELKETIRNLRPKGVLNTYISKYDYSDHDEFISYLGNDEIHRDWDTKENSYFDLFDRIVENAIINHVLDKVGKKEFKPIKEFINPKRIPLPIQKKDIKILYLDAIRVNKHAKEIANKLGLNVKFREDSNSGLGKYIKKHLGDYDIIIVSNLYSSNLLTMNNECTEQGKHTGRDLTLLMTYEDNDIWYSDEDKNFDFQGFGNQIKLRYIFSGLSTENEKRQLKEFRVLSNSYNSQYGNEGESDLQAILESAVDIYNEYLIKNNKDSLEDFDLKSAEQYDNEYNIVDEKEEQRQQLALKPIKDFDALRYRIHNYLDYKKLNLITEDIEGLRITETEKGFCVENIYEGRVLCTITFAKQYNDENLRVFSIQTLSNKGKLSQPEVVGVYTKKFENLDGVPNRPNEKQMNALISIEKKVEQLIAPLNMEAMHKYYNIPESEQKRLRKVK